MHLIIKRSTFLVAITTQTGSSNASSIARFDWFQELAKRLSRTAAFLLCATLILFQSARAADEPSPAVKDMCEQLWTTLLPQKPPGAEAIEEKTDKRVVMKGKTGSYILNFDDVAGDDTLSKKEFDCECYKAKKPDPFDVVNIEFSRSFLTLYYFNKFVKDAPFWLGLFSVMLFAATRFKVTLPEREKLSPPLSPRSYTTAFRYWIASFTYMGCFSTLYLTILLLGSLPGVHRRVLDYLAGSFTTELATPIWAALLSTAVIPAIPGIGNLDTSLRKRLQDFASIPIKARVIAEEVLARLKPPEPGVINKSTRRDRVVSAIVTHKKRLAELWEIKPKLENILDNQLSDRYSTFFSQNAEIEKALQTEVPSALASPKTDRASACYIEDKYRNTIPKVARFLICAMLSAEGTEPSVRDRVIDYLGFDIKRSVFRFNYGLLITVPSAIFLAVFISCLFAYLLYDLISGAGSGDGILRVLLSWGVPHDAIAKITSVRAANWHGVVWVFLSWSVQTVFLYLPPITVAAAAAMYVLDKTAMSGKGRLHWSEYLVAVLLTLFATGMLCFFILLGLGIMVPRLLEDYDKVMTVSQVWPWAIPPTLVATTYMWLSTYGINATRQRAQAWRYGLILSVVATLGSFVAYRVFLLDSTREKLAELMYPIPDAALGYLLSLSPALLGFVLGFVLSNTREPLTSQSA